MALRATKGDEAQEFGRFVGHASACHGERSSPVEPGMFFNRAVWPEYVTELLK
jgi:hypothetical protein